MNDSKTLRSELGASTSERIWVRGLDLCEDLIGKVNLGDMLFLELIGRLPNPSESRVTNAILVTLVEHGITPSALAARLTYLGAPESLQGAVAAGLSGLGSVFVGSIEGAAKLLHETLKANPLTNDSPAEEFQAVAKKTVAAMRAQKAIVPGLGHPIHVKGDPRTLRLFALAAEEGLSGRYVKLMTAFAEAASEASGRFLPLNATGAIGALTCELGFEPKIARGIGVASRAVGLIGHILEETRMPMAKEIWFRIDSEAAQIPGETTPSQP